MRYLVTLVLFCIALCSAQECEVDQLCANACYFHGSCQENGECICGEGWEGEDCDIPSCTGCEHGVCTSEGCVCLPGWTGNDCNTPFCIGENNCCNLEGFCSDNDEQPDLVTNPRNIKAFLEVEEFDECHCAVVEGCVSAGKRLLLKFNTETMNIGDADLQIGTPGDDLQFWDYHSCHGHAHFVDFMDFRITNSDGESASGHKAGFCIVDTIPNEASGRKLFSCAGVQGLQKGWSDIYDNHLDCQWVDVTGLNGSEEWDLELEVNPDRIIPESDYGNNLTVEKLRCEDGCNVEGISRCVFGQCVCYEGVDSSNCVHVDGWDDSLLTENPNFSSLSTSRESNDDDDTCNRKDSGSSSLIPIPFISLLVLVINLFLSYS